MFRIYSHTKLECLLQQLVAHMTAQPLPSPFETEVICVAHPQVQKWLQIQIAQKKGIEANTDYPLAANLIWSVLKSSGISCPDEDPLSLDAMSWRLFTLLPKLWHKAEFASIRHYLQQDDKGSKRWQLAQQIANVFDRYQYHHAQTLQNWQKNAQGWLAILWQQLSQGAQHNKLNLLNQFITAVQQNKVDVALLPSRIQVFAPTALPQFVLDFFYQLGKLTEVNFYLFVPTVHYWGDIVSDKQRERALRNNEGAYMEVGNPLLASWGQVGQVFQQKLLELDDLQWQEPEQQIHQDANAASLLQQVQQDIIDLKGDCATEKISKEYDYSIEIHQCYGAMRECQWLHDRILALLDNKGSMPQASFAQKPLKPEEILVLAPDIRQYAPYIEAVFSAGKDKPRLPWNLNDVLPTEQNLLVDAFLSLLDLPGSRFRQSDILPLLSLPQVQQRFELDEQAVELIREWINAARIRWGKHAQHKQQLGLPEAEENTWQFGLNRLMAGYAIGGDFGLFDNMVPACSISGTEAETLGRLQHFYQRLQYWSEKARQPQTAQNWLQLLNKMIDDFFADSEQGDSLLFIRQQLAQWLGKANEQGVDEKLDITLLKKVLQDKLQQAAWSQGFMSSGVTFSSLKPMRALPFRVIIILGMNEETFPRKQTRADFDELTARGDFSSAQQDRYLFLETLLSAREKLILSYSAFDPKNNDSKPASIVVDELLDYIAQRFADGQKITEKMLFCHHLQPWHPQYYQAGYLWQSYDRFWLEMAQKEKITAPQYHSWEDLPELSSWQADTVHLKDLLAFYRNPPRAVLQTRLKLYLQDQEDAFEDNEPLKMGGLESYQIKQRMLEQRLREALSETELEQQIGRSLRLEGKLPPAQLGKEALTVAYSQVAETLKQLQGFDEQSHFSHHFELPVKMHSKHTVILQGVLSGLYPQAGKLSVYPSKAKGKHYIQWWIEHLVLLCLQDEISMNCYHSTLLTEDQQQLLLQDCMNQHAAMQKLATLLADYLQGMRQPLALFPESSFKAARQLHKGEVVKVWKEWNGGDYHRGDSDDDYITLLCRQLEQSPIDSRIFIDTARNCYEDVLHYKQELTV